ncbi:MAG: hypothetical protein ACT4PV_00990 [Planctomycetaceae bacterium]
MKNLRLLHFRPLRPIRLPLLLGILCCAASLAGADTVVLKDGSVLEEAVAREESALRVGAKAVALRQVLLWEDAEGRPLYAPSHAALLRAYGILASRETLRRCREAFPKAVEAADAAAAFALLQRAEEAGLDMKEAEAWQAQAQKTLQAGTFEPPPDTALADLLAARAQACRAAGQEQRGLQLLRSTLRAAPDHAAAQGFLAEIAPANWRIGSARDWLDWRLEVMGERVRLLDRRHPDMDRARSFWTTDLFGFENPDVALLTNLKNPEIVGKCLRLSGLTCRALEQMFATDDPKREGSDPLVIYLYATLEEYVAKSGAGVGGGHGGMPLGLTLGHYNPSENISRFYWFERPDAERTVTTTFVHELTHHWIERACPRFTAQDRERSAATPGFWIVEGFAVFMEEARFDVARAAWTHFDPHAESLDSVATLQKAGKLVDWKKLYPLNQIEFAGLGKNFEVPVRRRWALRDFGFSETNCFYQQAGATCQFLYWGEEGAYRTRLLDFVTAYYTGDKDKTTIPAAFGLDPEELGKKVEAFAEAVAKGWRPGA